MMATSSQGVEDRRGEGEERRVWWLELVLGFERGRRAIAVLNSFYLFIGVKEQEMCRRSKLFGLKKRKEKRKEVM